jgi:hypothetical protein
MTVTTTTQQAVTKTGGKTVTMTPSRPRRSAANSTR